MGKEHPGAREWEARKSERLQVLARTCVGVDNLQRLEMFKCARDTVEAEGSSGHFNSIRFAE